MTPWRQARPTKHLVQTLALTLKEVKPVATIMIRHDVQDFDAWKRGYDDAESIRQAHNITHASAHRDPENPNTVMAVHQFDTLQDAKNFLEAIKPVMRAAGVVGQPEVWVGEDVA